MKNFRILFMTLFLGVMSLSAFSQDTIVNIAVTGKALAVQFDNNTYTYLEELRSVKPESFIKGRDYNGKRVTVAYADVYARTAATEILTFTGNAVDGDTWTIGSKVYTAQDALTNVDGNFHIAATASLTIDNLIAAITLTTGVSGVDYAAAMTIHPTVTAEAGGGDTMDITAKTRGTAANGTATTDTGTGAGTFGTAAMAGGAENGKLNLLTLFDAWHAAQ